MIKDNDIPKGPSLGPVSNNISNPFWVLLVELAKSVGKGS